MSGRAVSCVRRHARSVGGRPSAVETRASTLTSLSWVVEAKADDSAQDPAFVAKAAAAREWARAVTDDGDDGE